MQNLTGDSLAFIYASGSIINRKLEPFKKLHVDTGCLVALDPSVTSEIQFMGSVKSAMFGGDGVIFDELTCTGNVYYSLCPFAAWRVDSHNLHRFLQVAIVQPEKGLRSANKVFNLVDKI